MKQKHQHSTDAQKNRITECFFLRKKRMRCKKEYTYRERERERKVGNRHISICIMSLRKLLAFPFIFMPSTRLLYKIVQLHHEWIKRFEGRMWQANVGYKHNNKKYLLRIFLIFIIMISPYYCQSSAAFSLSLSLFRRPCTIPQYTPIVKHEICKESNNWNVTFFQMYFDVGCLIQKAPNNRFASVTTTGFGRPEQKKSNE